MVAVVVGARNARGTKGFHLEVYTVYVQSLHQVQALKSLPRDSQKQSLSALIGASVLSWPGDLTGQQMLLVRHLKKDIHSISKYSNSSEAQNKPFEPFENMLSVLASNCNPLKYNFFTVVKLSTNYRVQNPGFDQTVISSFMHIYCINGCVFLNVAHGQKRALRGSTR